MINMRGVQCFPSRTWALILAPDVLHRLHRNGSCVGGTCIRREIQA